MNDHVTESELAEAAPRLQRAPGIAEHRPLRAGNAHRQRDRRAAGTGSSPAGRFAGPGQDGVGQRASPKRCAWRRGASSSRRTCCRATSPAIRSSRKLTANGSSCSNPGRLFANLVLGRRDQPGLAQDAERAAGSHAGTPRDGDGRSRTRCPTPFFVLATQNPIELEGTYPLPEAQLDRFSLQAGSASQRRGRAGAHRATPRDRRGTGTVEPVLDRERVDRAGGPRGTHLPAGRGGQLHRAAGRTPRTPGSRRPAGGIRFGASPRAALGLAAAARARALLQGRLNASFEDVGAVAVPVLGHRIVLDYNARVDGQTAGARPRRGAAGRGARAAAA